MVRVGFRAWCPARLTVGQGRPDQAGEHERRSHRQVQLIPMVSLLTPLDLA